MAHRTGKDMGMPQKAHRHLHVPRFQQAANVGAGNACSVQRLLREDNQRESVLTAEVPEHFGISLPAASKPEIISADKSPRSPDHQRFQKFLPIS